MIAEPAAYFTRGCGRCDRFDTPDCAARLWPQGLAQLREICLAAALDETVKWGQPCYTHTGRNIAIIGAFRDSFVLGFFNASLLSDPNGVLEAKGPNSQTAGTIRFTADDQPAQIRAAILALLGQAKTHAAAGTKPAKTVPSFDLPAELVEALDADAALAEAFRALTPGRQRSHVIALSSAKTAETRIRRIEKLRDRIIAGKGAMER